MRKAVFATIVMAGVLAASAASAQAGKPANPMPCPTPTAQLLQMSVPVVVTADFPPTVLAAPRAGINDSALDKYFLHSFVWQPPPCCQIISATLTVTMRANFAGYLPTAGPGNDNIGLYANGGLLAGMGGTLYTVPFPANFTTTKTIAINPAGLAAMNANGRLSFVVQDDTAVLSASLQISRCCVNVK